MEVSHLVYYLIHQDGLNWRDQDFLANRIVKCVKGEEFNGTFQIKLVGGALKTFDFATRAQFLQMLWPLIAKKLLPLFEGEACLVPIPNSIATKASCNGYNTLAYAQAIANSSQGRLTAMDALRWKEALDPQHKVSGRRTPEARYNNMCLIAKPEKPVILFDDFLTSGSSMVAACWHLNETKRAPIRAAAVGRRTEQQHTMK